MHYEQETLRECEDALFRLAAVIHENDEADRLLLDIERGEGIITAKELDELCKGGFPSFSHAMEKQESKARFHDILHHTLPRLAQVACVMLALGVIGTTVAFAASASFRVAVMNFLIDVQQEYTTLSMEPSGVAFDVPAGWEGQYFPSYIPEGYEVSQVDWYLGEGSVDFINGKGEMLFFAEYSKDTVVNWDTEGAEQSNITIKGAPGLKWKKDGRVSLAWAWFDRFFIVRTDSDEDMALRISSNIEKIS